MDNKFTPWCGGLGGYESNSCSWIKYELFWVLKEIYPKIHGNVDITWVAIEIVLCDIKKESSTFVYTHMMHKLIIIHVKQKKVRKYQWNLTIKI